MSTLIGGCLPVLVDGSYHCCCWLQITWWTDTYVAHKSHCQMPLSLVNWLHTPFMLCVATLNCISLYNALQFIQCWRLYHTWPFPCSTLHESTLPLTRHSKLGLSP